MTGPDNSTIASLFEYIAESANLEGRTVFVALSSGQSPNLKTALKYINQRATSQNLDSQDDAVLNDAKVSKFRLKLYNGLLMPIGWPTLELRSPNP